MRLVWLLPLVLAGCASLKTPGPDLSPMPDDLRDAPAVQVFPAGPGEALYLLLVSQDPETAAETVLGLPAEDRDLLGRYVVENKGREDFWTARFELDPALPANESAFICWYLGGFTAYATVGRR